MRRTAIATAMAAMALVACATGKNRDFAVYYDPEGLFSASLPAANDIAVAPSQPPSQGPSVLTGVVSTPPAPSPSPSSAFGGGLTDLAAQTTGPQDQTVYEALAVADVVRDGQKVAGVAAAFTLGQQGVGYIVLAIFPPGDWASERSDFLKVVGSFRPGVPPGMKAFPLAGGTA